MASEHIIKSYDEELRRLNNTITRMGGLAESQVAAAIDGWLDGVLDAPAAERLLLDGLQSREIRRRQTRPDESEEPSVEHGDVEAAGELSAVQARVELQLDLLA